MSGDHAKVLTKSRQEAIGPEEALDLLREGNRRFVSGRLLDRPHALHVEATSEGQFPFAAVLGCIDSRVPVETVFDQGIGDIFTTRVAGNVINTDVLASLEFACEIAGAKAVLVLGHTSCGAVQAAITEVGGDSPLHADDPRWTNLTGLVGKLRPAIDAARGEHDYDEPDFADRVAAAHVRLVTQSLREESAILGGKESNGEIAIAGAIYDVRSGEVRFL